MKEPVEYDIHKCSGRGEVGRVIIREDIDNVWKFCKGE